ncbi:MAG: hypothetical protein ACXW3Z_11330 [Limisphaerales bacterium]
MKSFWSGLVLMVCLAGDAMAQETQRSQVPEGRFDGPKVITSGAYPGTPHTYWVYVPAQYDPAKPAALVIFNDEQVVIRAASS